MKSPVIVQFQELDRYFIVEEEPANENGIRVYSVSQHDKLQFETLEEATAALLRLKT